MRIYSSRLATILPQMLALRSRSAALARRLTAVVLLMAFIASSFGVMPTPAAIAKLLGADPAAGVAYPCQGCGCGCAGAVECWTACCCHTPEERLVWALEHGVQPPAFARFSDAQWIAAANRVKPGSASCAACIVGIKGTLAKGIALAAPASDAARTACCSKRPESSTCCETKSDACRNAAAPRASHALPVASALGCKGLSPLMPIATVPAVPLRGALTVITLHFGQPPSPPAAALRQYRFDRPRDVAAPPPKRLA